jgi:ketosteroid isomerase-like protein
MSQENVELVYRAHEAFNRRDLEAFMALIDPEAELIPLNVELPGVISYRGHDGFRSFWDELFDSSPGFTTEVDEVYELGNVTIARVRLGEKTSWQVAEWRRGKAVLWHSCRSEADALENARLRE